MRDATYRGSSGMRSQGLCEVKQISITFMIRASM